MYDFTKKRRDRKIQAIRHTVLSRTEYWKSFFNLSNT